VEIRAWQTVGMLTARLWIQYQQTKTGSSQEEIQCTSARTSAKKLDVLDVRQEILNCLDEIKDREGLVGPYTVWKMLHSKGKPIPRDLIRTQMRELDPEGPMRRFPKRRSTAKKVGLLADDPGKN